MNWDIELISYGMLLDKSKGYVGQLMFRENVYDMKQ